MSNENLLDRARGAQRLRNAKNTRSEELTQFKKELHNELIDGLDFALVDNTPREELTKRLRNSLTQRVEARRFPLNRVERERLIDELLDDILGLGPIEPLLRDPEVTDIMANGHNEIYVERKGQMQLTEVKFESDYQMLQIIERVVTAVGRRIDEQNPMVDARMKDGSRFNAIIPPLSLDGPCLAIRRFGTIPITAEDLVALASCPRPMLELLRGAVQAKLNIIISGGSGSGKTTLLNVLSSCVDEEERIITIEDSAELQLQQEHVVRLETRPANLEGKGEVTQRDLVRNCLRMRPDRIILGEIRGPETVDMLTAMNTGHDGSLATVHANNSRDALARIETMVGMGMPNLSDKSIRETIARALDIVIQTERLSDGTRRVVTVTEVTGMEGDVISTQDVFTFTQTGIEENGKVRGRFEATGLRPHFHQKLEAHGIDVSPDTYKFSLEV